MAEIQPKEDAKMSNKAKLYLLTSDGNWEDCGTGFVEIVKETINGQEIEFIQVTVLETTQLILQNLPAAKLKKRIGNKDDKKYILYRPILKLNEAKKQGESIITWIDAESEEEMAISFLTPETAEEIWKTIKERTKVQ